LILRCWGWRICRVGIGVRVGVGFGVTIAVGVEVGGGVAEEEGLEAF